MIHLCELIDEIAAARERNNEEEAQAILTAFTSSRASQPKQPATIPPLYPPKTAKRESLTELRWIHLDHVSDMASRPFNRDETFRVLRNNYEHFYGKLRRRRRDEVPSDELRKDLIVHRILNIVEAKIIQDQMRPF